MLNRDHPRWLIEQTRSRMPGSAGDVDAWLMPMLSAYADFIYDMPASGPMLTWPYAERHHGGRWGLLDHSLETALWTLIEDLPPGLSHFVHDAVRLQAYVGGLFHDIGKAYKVVVQTDVDRWLPGRHQRFAGRPERKLGSRRSIGGRWWRFLH